MNSVAINDKCPFHIHFSTVGVDIDPRNDTSIVQSTIVGNRVCMTYNPPAKTKMKYAAGWPGASNLQK